MPAMTRRDALRRAGGGFGHLALLGLLGGAGRGAAQAGGVLPGTHFPAKAKRVIFLFMHGGPSQVDTFDFKPDLIAQDGKPLPFEKPRVQFAKTGDLGRPRWEFKQHGQCGAHVSSLFPEVAGHVDDLCLLKAVHGTNEAHGGALLKLHTGSDSLVRPSMGSWVTYGLGTENENLPGFITLGPTLGHGGSANWSSAFLPADHAGTRIGKRGQEIAEASIAFLNGGAGQGQRAQLDLIQAMNRDHHAARGEGALEARIRSFETAYRMQTEAPEAMSIEGESATTKALYGIDDPSTENFGRQCLLARRFAERGVRFVQATHAYWDSHNKLEEQHSKLSHACDRPIAGLLTDLKARGLLDETLVLWGGEFGRTPTMQGKDGRDHNPHGFTMWMAGGGVKGGMSHGATDAFGFYAEQGKVHIHDLHATILHLLGIDHERLTFNHAGRDFRLTDVHGRVVTEILA